jgi:hypothetical protein
MTKSDAKKKLDGILSELNTSGDAVTNDMSLGQLEVRGAFVQHGRPPSMGSEADLRYGRSRRFDPEESGKSAIHAGRSKARAKARDDD